ncbi:hypothetical protein B9Q11_03345 [Candidatus Marsarchaeota G2 archaeon ECH_B_SAG-F08]|jgi:Ribosomal protein S3AE|uniref:30S ribosomal protein S3Ae n=2 Tax=Candidatus Marsarchaeota TaxID=1978152 RepID=A0A2R6AK34_9ARCH|nr:MAG: hypothetical protein B9Q02_00775 [Candidatus Marsarchaeota G1 archaeon BE_D]PSN97900.1 MAG: hypothetical protein B9Q11_03345 [Candidatus Marsarchaeota G2 archaeon ECH_B_SAG-F08]
MSSKVQKVWISVSAPPNFNQAPLPKILASSPEAVLNRRVTVSLSDITGDIRQAHVFVKFRIIEVTDNTAKTRFDQLELAREFVRGMARRGTTKTEVITDVFTKDDAHLRIFIVAISKGRLHRSKRTAIRKVAGEILINKATNLLFDQFTQELVFGKMTSEIFAAARKIANISTLEVRKVKVLRPPTHIVEAPQNVEAK